jgi:uncharacterized protein (DUF983 family)
MSNAINIVTCTCPKCENGKIFGSGGNVFLLKMAKMDNKCQNCNYKFEIEPGFFFGAMYVSYGIVIAEIVACMILFWYLLGLSPVVAFSLIAGIIILISNFNFKLSRSIWIYMFYREASDKS